MNREPTTALLLLAALLFPILSASAQTRIDQSPPVASGLAYEQVDVQINYSGAEVVLFVAAPPSDTTNTIAAALIGPRTPHTVTQNTDAGPQNFTFRSAPSVFVIGAEPELLPIVDADSLREAGLSQTASAIPAEEHATSPELSDWRQAFVALKRQQNLYSRDIGHIERVDDNLIRARMTLPPNAPPGDYTVRAVVFENGSPIGSTEQPLNLVRSGMEATLYDLATNHGVIYGFLAVFLGTLVGFAAAWIGRR